MSLLLLATKPVQQNSRIPRLLLRVLAPLVSCYSLVTSNYDTFPFNRLPFVFYSVSFAENRLLKNDCESLKSYCYFCLAAIRPSSTEAYDSTYPDI